MLWVSLEPNYDLSFPWADISGTAGSRREVKPACVCPNVKEFKTFFFFHLIVELTFMGEERNRGRV